MGTVRIQVVVPEDRKLTISLPPDVAPGKAEVIILTTSPGLGANATALLDLVDGWRARYPHRRSKEEIDRYLAEERNSWAPSREGLPR